MTWHVFRLGGDLLRSPSIPVRGVEGANLVLTGLCSRVAVQHLYIDIQFGSRCLVDWHDDQESKGRRPSEDARH